MPPQPPADAERRRRILVADEDPEVVDFIIKSLREDRHAVFHAYDGRAAAGLSPRPRRTRNPGPTHERIDWIDSIDWTWKRR